MFFQKATFIRPYCKAVCNYIWREELQPAIHSFKRTGFFLGISLSYLFFHVGSFFHGAVEGVRFLRGYKEHIIFDSKYLLRTTTFLEVVAQNFNLVRQVYLFHNFNCSHPSFDIGYLLLSLKEWQWFILWSVLCLFWWENLQFSCLSNSFSSNVYLVKKVGSSYALFQKYYN